MISPPGKIFNSLGKDLTFILFNAAAWKIRYESPLVYCWPGPALWPRHRMLLCPILGCREERLALLLTLGQMFSIYIHDTDIGE